MNEEMEMISRAAHDADMARMERSIKRTWILTIILICALILTNAGWIIYEAQYEDVVALTQEADGEGDVILNGAAKGNVTYYGEGKTNNSPSSR